MLDSKFLNDQMNRSSRLEYRQVGQTDLQISAIGFGASPLGNVFGPIDAEEGRRAVHLAIDEGINFFDVSPYYGLTLAEERLGQALLGKRHRVVLSTKCGRYGVDQFDFSASRIRLSIEESLRRLRTDYIDLWLAHDVEFGDAEQIINETIPAMRSLQRQGKVRYVGISGYPLKVLMHIAEKAPVDCILSYCHYNLLIDDMDSVLMPFAEKLAIGVINASPLHMGMLTERGAAEWHPAPLKVRLAVKEAQSFCQMHGVDLAEMAIQFCLDYPRVKTTLVGMASAEEVRRNLRAYRNSPDRDLMRQIKTMLAPVSNMQWPSGTSENCD